MHRDPLLPPAVGHLVIGPQGGAPVAGAHAVVVDAAANTRLRRFQRGGGRELWSTPSTLASRPRKGRSAPVIITPRFRSRKIAHQARNAWKLRPASPARRCRCVRPPQPPRRVRTARTAGTPAGSGCATQDVPAGPGPGRRPGSGRRRGASRRSWADAFVAAGRGANALAAFAVTLADEAPGPTARGGCAQRLGWSIVPVQFFAPQRQAQSFFSFAVCGSSRTMP